MAEIGDRDLLIGDPPGQRPDLVMRALEELFEHAELVHQLGRMFAQLRRMQPHAQAFAGQRERQ